MKRIIALLLAVIMLVSFAACGTQKEEKKEPEKKLATLQELYEKNYQRRSAGNVRGKLKALFAAEDGSDYYVFSAPATFDAEKAFNDLDIFDDSYEDDMKNLLLSIDGAALENVTDKLPSQDELNKFVGKTLADMNAAGFSEIGSFYTDDAASFTYTNKVYECELGVDPKTGSEDDTSTYVIKDVKLYGLSPDIIDEPLNIEEMLARVEKEGNVKPFYDNLFGAITKESGDCVIDLIRFEQMEDEKIYAFDVIPQFTAEDKAEYQRIHDLPMDTDEEWDTYFEERQKFICSLKIDSITDISDRIPTQEELDVYIGKTPADMEKDGFTQGEFSMPPFYYYENDRYICGIMVEPDNTISYIAFSDIK